MSIAQHIIEPYYASFTPLGRALPTWIYGGILACVSTLQSLV
jgi:all-trans-retinol dehydrogenase (NAD+)